MKKKVWITITLILSLHVIAQNNNTKLYGSSYCAKVKDGVTVVVYQDNPITSDILLDNGSIIKPDGTIITKEGNRRILRDGECINQDGTTSAKEKINQK